MLENAYCIEQAKDVYFFGTCSLLTVKEKNEMKNVGKKIPSGNHTSVFNNRFKISKSSLTTEMLTAK